MFWNSLPRNLRDPSYTAAVFGRSLKHFFSHSTVHCASEAFATMRYRRITTNKCVADSNVAYILNNIFKFIQVSD